MEAVVNKVWFLDAVRGEADVYNMTWQKYLAARANDEARRRREKANAEKKAGALRDQAAKFGAKANKAAAAKQMLARADRMLDNLDEVRQEDKYANISFPEPAACGKTPLNATGLTKMYGSLEGSLPNVGFKSNCMKCGQLNKRLRIIQINLLSLSAATLFALIHLLTLSVY